MAESVSIPMQNIGTAFQLRNYLKRNSDEKNKTERKINIFHQR